MAFKDSKMDNPITRNTPVSIALVLALCGGTFWMGSNANRLSNVEGDVVDIKSLLKDVSAIAVDSKIRLDLAERFAK